MLLCLIFAGFFFIPKIPHRIIFYALLLCALWAYKEALNIQAIKTNIKSLFESSPFTWMFFGYCVVSSLLIGIFSTGDIMGGQKEALLTLLFIIILLAVLRTYQDWKKLLFIYVLGALVIGAGICIAFYGVEGKSFLIRTDRYWGIGRGENPNISGLLYGLAAIIAYTMYTQWDFLKWKGKDYRFVFMCAVIVICALVVLATQSRGTIVALGITGIIILLLQKRYILLSLGLLSVIALFTAIVLVMGDFSDFLSRADNGRFGIWEQGFLSAIQNPIIGKGFGHEAAHTIPMGTWRSTHNIYLGTLVYHGAVGLALFLACWLSTFKTIFQNARQTGNLTIIAIMIYASTFGLFEFHILFLNLNPEWLVIWLPITYAMFIKQQENP